MISPGMKKSICLILCIFCGLFLFAQPPQLIRKTQTVMKAATRYMMDSISLHGGFVWYYLPDKSRRWGEMEAYPSMIWVQDGGTVSVGNVLLDAYAATNDEAYYHWARQSALTLIGGQSPNGGWNYMIDLNGEASLKQWYATIGKNGWRLEEFQHFYGNDTFDDDVTSGAARFLLRLYLLKKTLLSKLRWIKPSTSSVSASTQTVAGHSGFRSATIFPKTENRITPHFIRSTTM